MMTRKVIKTLISMTVPIPFYRPGIDPIFRADAQCLLTETAAADGERALEPVRAYIDA
jgi:hypothetical protein